MLTRRSISQFRIVMLSVSLIALSSFVSKPANAQILTNGSFEVPAPPSGSYTTITAGSTALTGWTVEQGSVDVTDKGFWQVYDGNASLDLDGTGGSHPAGTISQSFATAIGTSYFVSFAYSNHYAVSSASALVTITDTNLTSLVSSTISHSGSTASNMNYSIFNTSFVADTATSTIRFTSLDTALSQTGIVLDAVRVTAASASAPEPSSLALVIASFSLGIFGLGSYCRHRSVRVSEN